ADAWQGLGDVDYTEQRMADAFDPYQKATQIREGLVQTHSNNAAYKEKLATMYNRLAIALSGGKGQPVAALESDRKCAEIRLELIRDYPDSPTLQYGLGECFLNLGSKLGEKGHYREALAMLLRSQEFYRAACAGMPYMVEYAVDLGGAYLRAGNQYWNLGRREQAFEQYQRGVDHFLARVRSYPDVPLYRVALAKDAGQLSTSFRGIGRKEDVRKLLRRVCEALDDVPVPTGDDLYLLVSLQGQSTALIGYGKKELTPEELANERRELDQ